MQRSQPDFNYNASNQTGTISSLSRMQQNLRLFPRANRELTANKIMNIMIEDNMIVCLADRKSVYTFDMNTGKTLWTYHFGMPFSDSLNNNCNVEKIWVSNGRVICVGYITTNIKIYGTSCDVLDLTTGKLLFSICPYEESEYTVKANDVVSLGALEEIENEYSELIYLFFWHDKRDTITGCYEGKANYYNDPITPQHHPRVMNDVRWVLRECKKRGLLKF